MEGFYVTLPLLIPAITSSFHHLSVSFDTPLFPSLTVKLFTMSHYNFTPPTSHQFRHPDKLRRLRFNRNFIEAGCRVTNPIPTVNQNTAATLALAHISELLLSSLSLSPQQQTPATP